jgi:hypothetical protein
MAVTFREVLTAGRDATSPLRRGDMPTHRYHEGLPGFDPDAILHDGCEECESRAGIHGLGSLDWKNSQRAVRRAVDWNYGRLATPPGVAEAGLLRDVWMMLVWLRSNTELNPIQGELPWTDFERMEREMFDRG